MKNILLYLLAGIGLFSIVAAPHELINNFKSFYKKALSINISQKATAIKTALSQSRSRHKSSYSK